MERQRSTFTSSITCTNPLKCARNTARTKGPSSSPGEHYDADSGNGNMVGLGHVKGMQSFHRPVLGRANCPTMRTTRKNFKEGIISRAINRRKLHILPPIAEETICEGDSDQEYHDAEDALSDFSPSGLFEKQSCTSSLKQVTSNLEYESDHEYNGDNDYSSLDYHSPLKLFEEKLAELQLFKPEQFIDIDEYLNSDIQVVDYFLISCFYPDETTNQDNVTGGAKYPLKKKRGIRMPTLRTDELGV